MLFAMNIDKADYEALKTAHTIIGDFYVATRHYVAKNAGLQSVLDNVENKTLTDDKIQTTISNMKHLLAERLMRDDFAWLAPEQQAEAIQTIEMQCSVVEAQAFDYYIGIVERFTSASIIATHLLPAKAKEYPVVFAQTMEKYGMKRTANIIYHHLALLQD